MVTGFLQFVVNHCLSLALTLVDRKHFRRIRPLDAFDALPLDRVVAHNVVDDIQGTRVMRWTGRTV